MVFLRHPKFKNTLKWGITRPLSCKLAKETIIHANWFLINSKKNAPSSKYIKISHLLIFLLPNVFFFFVFFFFPGLLQTRYNVFSCNKKVENLKSYYLRGVIQRAKVSSKYVCSYFFQLITWRFIKLYMCII